MLNTLISWSLQHRIAVLLLTGALVIGGIFALRQLDIDAFPDTTPVQVQVNTVAPALASEEMERQLTAPIEQALGGLPRVEVVRSISKFGFSQVTVGFADGTDIYFARQLVSERLAAVELPAEIARPQLGPVATGLGEVFHYVVRSRAGDLTHARTVQDWVIKPALQTVPGVAEVNSWGGYEKQFEIQLDLQKLVDRQLNLETVIDRIQASNLNVGGGVIAHGAEVLVVQGLGRLASTAELEQIVVAVEDGIPVRLTEVATIAIGHEIRRGAVTADGRGEAVLGLGFMLMGENTHAVTSRLSAKLAELRPFLPPDIVVDTVYERTALVDQVIDTVRGNLFTGGLLVIAVLFMFLGNIRAGLIVALAIPLSLMVAFGGMLHWGITASLLSLGALDFGLVVDSSVIMIENAVRRLRDPSAVDRPRLEIIREAALEVRKPTMFGELIIIIVYLPILTLEGVEGKLFQPMALTVIFALLGSMLLSLTLMPVLASFLLRAPRSTHEPLVVRIVTRLYTPLLRVALRYRVAVVGATISVALIAIILGRGLGTEFVPRLSEGALAINVIRLPGTSLETSVALNTAMERLLRAEFPNEIAAVWSRIGTAEVATDPMGIELTDTFITLTPLTQWRKARDQADLTAQIQRLVRELPGQRIALTQPIEMRINEMVSGVRGDVAIKIFGDDLALLREKAAEVQVALYGVDGASDITVEQTAGQPALQIIPDPVAMAQHGMVAADVLRVVEAIGGIGVGELMEEQLRFPIVVRLPPAVRHDVASLAALPVATASGNAVPLGTVARIATGPIPLTISRESGQRRIVVQANIRGRDVAGFVAAAKAAIAMEVTLPPGRYRIEWGGQFEQLERARLRLAIIVPVALGSIFGLLWWSLSSGRLAALVFTAVPMAVSGGVFALWLRELPFSISAAVGFIALAGVAVLNGLVMVTFIHQLRRRGLSCDEAITSGSVIRLRPVLMTALVAALGFVPMAFAHGMGAEVQRPLATVVIGGIISSTLITLFLIPVLYRWFEPRHKIGNILPADPSSAG